MSVIEFFMNYWDWYLLIGVVMGITGYFINPDNLDYKDWTTYLGMIIGVSLMSVFWLPALIGSLFKK